MSVKIEIWPEAEGWMWKADDGESFFTAFQSEKNSYIEAALKAIAAIGVAKQVQNNRIPIHLISRANAPLCGSLLSQEEYKQCILITSASVRDIAIAMGKATCVWCIESIINNTHTLNVIRNHEATMWPNPVQTT